MQADWSTNMATCAGVVEVEGVRTLRVSVGCTEGVQCTGKCTQALLRCWQLSLSYFQDGGPNREETLEWESKKADEKGPMDDRQEEEGSGCKGV